MPNPQEIKKIDPSAYFQVIHQMVVTDCLNGFLSYYHPDLPVDEGGLRIIEFRKAQKVVDEKGKDAYPIVADIKLMNQRKLLALEESGKIISKISAKSLIL